MASAIQSDYPLWIKPIDHTGVPIPEEFINAALRVWPRALACALRTGLDDESEAAEIMDSVVESCSKCLKGRKADNLEFYIFRSFLNALTRSISRRRRFSYVGSSYDAEAFCKSSSSPDLETKILLREVMDCLDVRFKAIFLRRLLGYDWKEIRHGFKTKSNSIQVMFSKHIHQVKENLNPRRCAPAVPKRSLRSLSIDTPPLVGLTERASAPVRRVRGSR